MEAAHTHCNVVKKRQQFVKGNELKWPIFPEIEGLLKSTVTYVMHKTSI